MAKSIAKKKTLKAAKKPANSKKKAPASTKKQSRTSSKRSSAKSLDDTGSKASKSSTSGVSKSSSSKASAESGKKGLGKKAAKKKSSSAKKISKKAAASSSGKQLVIVESPAKAKTINKYLGQDFVVRASIGHIRDLPSKSPKGVKQPVPGVDLEQDFAPTYEVLAEKTKTVTELKREAKQASEVWFATDLDREGEAIAWHLSEVLGIDSSEAKRVVFNAITREEIRRAFAQPRGINLAVVNAQQARRILDRIVGYQASPLLWKKVARGLSAGRVQSVAVRMVVERERAIEAFVPDELWRVIGRLTTNLDTATKLQDEWLNYLSEHTSGKGPTLKQQQVWMSERDGIRCELVEIDGKKFELGCKSTEVEDLSDRVIAVATACGLKDVEAHCEIDPEGKGPAKWRRSITGRINPQTRYRVRSIETRKATSRPSAPFITSTLQIAAANRLGFAAQRTMRLAQDLYEGLPLSGLGEVGLITYMRTDATHLSTEAIEAIRGYVAKEFGDAYLPAKANNYTSSNKSAQEAHEAIRPTDVSIDPEKLKGLLSGPRAESHYKLYKLIWSRAVGSQMTPAVWDATTVTFERSDEATGAAFRASGRILAFDGFYKAVGIPTDGDEQVLPAFEKDQILAPFAIQPEQKFSSPPPRFSEASLVKALESEGIGRPSTYASIIQVIQDRKYVEQIDRRFFATDLGEVVTDKLVEAFPELMSVGYTREMESELDEVEGDKADWVEMLQKFYGAFSSALNVAHEDMTHAKAEIQPAAYQCPECGAKTCFRFGKNGRFLSCTAYPECNYAAPIDRRGRPLLPEQVDIACPLDGSEMELRKGRFGTFVASVKYPEVNFVLNVDKKGGLKYPTIPPLLIEELQCPKCSASMNLRRGKRGPWFGCSTFPKCRGRIAWSSLDEVKQAELEKKLAKHERSHPIPKISRHDGREIAEGTPISELAIPGGVAELEIHPDFQVEESA